MEDGTYVITGSENYDTYLEACGMPDPQLTRMVTARPVVDITSTATDTTTSFKNGDNVFRNTLIYGQDNVTDCNGTQYVTNVSPTPTGYAGTMTVGGRPGTIEFRKNEEGYVLSMSIEDISCRRQFKRL